MYNWDLQNLIAAFVDSMRGSGQAQHDLYISVLHGFADLQSNLLTMLGYPPVP